MESEEAHVGLRVRVRLNGHRDCEDAPHALVEDGQTGTIIDCRCSQGGAAHP